MSIRTSGLIESVIREMTRLAERHGAINLAQGAPDFNPPPEVVEAAVNAVRCGENQYSVTWGRRETREAVAEYLRKWRGVEYNPETEITITCGSSEALLSAVLALVNPGEEVVVMEPFYENYVPAVTFAGARPLFVEVGDEEGLKRAVTRRPSALILNSPHNPTGKVFTVDEIRLITDLAEDYGFYVISDEIYEHLVYEGRFISPSQINRERTIAVNGMSKTYSATGWRVGYVAAPADAMREIRKVHDYATVCAPTPFQAAYQVALSLGEDYYTSLRNAYRRRRDLLAEGLSSVGFDVRIPQGAYYMVAGISRFSTDSEEFARMLPQKCGVAVVPGTAFYSNPGRGADWVRFNFAKSEDILKEAIYRLTSRFKIN